ncbi:MAG: HAD family phosphatase [Prevotella sp.]|jgi:HAD superfamily hydrolase (TIGR01509 family)|nr:HAD family phosphatase [Prevotella sp.]
MTKISTVLFDFDGVIADTEPQYDIHINALGEKYNLGVKNFALQVKGTTSPDILKKYFNHLPSKEQSKIAKELEDFELNMDFPLVEGVMGFIGYLKENNYKTGIVTSSQDLKMKRALNILQLSDTFDVVVTAARITEGKPNPMCYKLAAEDLHSSPPECVVFEDSLHGIRAGQDAGMRVIGVSTTIPKEILSGKTNCVIPDFTDIQQIIKYLN